MISLELVIFFMFKCSFFFKFYWLWWTFPFLWFLLLILHLVSSSFSSSFMWQYRSLVFCLPSEVLKEILLDLILPEDLIPIFALRPHFLPAEVRVILSASDLDLAALTHFASWARRRCHRVSSWPHYKHLFCVIVFSFLKNPHDKHTFLMIFLG